MNAAEVIAGGVVVASLFFSWAGWVTYEILEQRASREPTRIWKRNV